MRIISWFILCSFIFVGASCSQKAAIREKAIRYESETELNGLIEYYSRCYYKLPNNISQLIYFLEKWEEHAPESYWSHITSDPDMRNLLKKDNPLISSYGDSLFIYLKKQRLGCCVYGHPYYWIEHADAYPYYRPDYWENFRVAAFDEQDNYLFDFPYYDFHRTVVNSIASQRSAFNSTRNRLCPLVAFYDSTLDTLYVASPLPKEENLKLGFMTDEGIVTVHIKDLYGSGIWHNLHDQLRFFYNNASLVGKILVPLVVETYQL